MASNPLSKAMRIGRSVYGRAYEVGLKFGVVPYRRPFTYYTTELWNQGYASGEHDHYEDISDRPRYAAIAGYLGAIPGPLAILDMGCGTGVMRERIPEEKVGAYLGIDTAESAIARARQRGFARSEFQVGGEPSRSDFDAVICNEMLYLVPDPDAFLAMLKRHLRPGGLLVTSNTRFTGDFKLREMIEQHFTRIDEAVIWVASKKWKWRVGCYRN
jgi:2-polyprenyl-3-methyl-5-hydroxy-6-metoxy-1,4-benzoquinol methylase